MMIFSLGDQDISRVNEWKAAHDCGLSYQGAIGGKYTYCFSPTNLGIVVKVRCACGSEIDVTDYDSW